MTAICQACGYDIGTVVLAITGIAGVVFRKTAKARIE